MNAIDRLLRGISLFGFFTTLQIALSPLRRAYNTARFHARYGPDKAAIAIGSLRILEGRLPPRTLGLVIEWAAQHQDELMRDWQLARNEKPPEKIAPLA